MNDIEFLKQLADWIDSGAEFMDSLGFTIEIGSDDNSEYSDRLRQIAGRLENLQTLEKGYKVIEEDLNREARDRWKDRSE